MKHNYIYFVAHFESEKKMAKVHTNRHELVHSNLVAVEKSVPHLNGLR